MVITNSMKRRFVKDTGLPIKVFENTVFANRLALMDKMFDTTTKWNEFVALADQFNEEREFFEAQESVNQAALEFIRNSDAMNRFAQDEDMSRFKLKNEGYPGNGVFKDNNVGKYLLSIDMVKANFTALRHYDPTIFGNAKTYEEFIGLFTTSEYIKKSKYIRQVIFGNIVPKRQQRYEQYLMDQLLTRFFSVMKFPRKTVMYFGADEIVFDVSAYVENGTLPETMLNRIDKIVSEACDEGVNVRAEYYKLVKIEGTSGYIKQFMHWGESPTLNQKDFEIKGIDPIEYPFVLRALYDEQPKDTDFIFNHEGRLAKLLEPIKVSFAETIEKGE